MLIHSSGKLYRPSNYVANIFFQVTKSVKIAHYKKRFLCQLREKLNNKKPNLIRWADWKCLCWAYLIPELCWWHERIQCHWWSDDLRKQVFQSRWDKLLESRVSFCPECLIIFAQKKRFCLDRHWGTARLTRWQHWTQWTVTGRKTGQLCILVASSVFQWSYQGETWGILLEYLL